MEETITPIGELITSTEHIFPDTRVKDVAERFFQEKYLDALALVELGKPVGLVTRNKLLFTLFRRFGFELHERKPIFTIADKEPLSVNRSLGIDETLDRALSRPFQDVYDDIIVVDDDDNFIGLLSVKQIVIEQSNALANSIMQKELANAKAMELEKVNNIKSQFIANVTHELRAPVNAIIGLAELMKISCDKGYIDQLTDRLDLLSSSALGLRAIITNILDLSKVEAGRMEVIPELFDPAPVLKEVADTTSVLLGKKPVFVEVHAVGSPYNIFTDRVKLRQILTNLMSNAAKFTDEGRIILEARKEEGRFFVSVRDTGIGIREEDLKRLFTAFTQLEDAHTKRHEGTGLGLTITKHMVDLLGGEISISSSFGEGTKFEISLPLDLMENGNGNGKEKNIDNR
ncbi:MAG: ATP-binding protein [Nitrospirota bacterium]